MQPCDLADFNYQIDPYIGCEHYCCYCYVLGQAETDWTQELLTHQDIAGRLESELRGIQPQRIYLGWHTDPYQPCEASSRQTRMVLGVLASKGFSASILTKSDLVLRDMDLLRSMPEASVSVSVAFEDELIRGLFEANTKETRTRIGVLSSFKRAGVRTTSLICPVIPYVSDATKLVDMLAPHTAKIWIYGLSILDKTHENWRNLNGILKNHFPELRDRIEAAVFSKDDPYWHELRQQLMRMQDERQLNLSIHL